MSAVEGGCPSPRTHELKCWPVYFPAVADGRKTVELRRNDRAYAVGDQLLLREWDPVTQCYTGAHVMADVHHILRDPDGRWLQPGIVALSITVAAVRPQPLPGSVADKLSRWLDVPRSS